MFDAFDVHGSYGSRRSLPRPAAALLWAGLLLAVPAGANTIVVTSTLDLEADDGLCTFREAATASNTNATTGVTPGECAAGNLEDTILFALAPGSTIALSALPVIFTEGVNIHGPGHAQLDIQQSAQQRVLVLDGNAQANSSFDLVGFTITGGVANLDYLGGNVGVGGGVLVYHVGLQLTVADVRFRNNNATTSGAALAFDAVDGDFTNIIMQDSIFESNSVNSGLAGGGGALSLDIQGSAYLRRLLFVDNHAGNAGVTSASDGQGGAIWLPPLADGTLELSESTFSANSAAGSGGAISFGTASAPAFSPTVVTTIVDCTFTGNTADDDNDAAGPSGGALNTLFSGELVTVRNSILAGNFDLHVADPAPNVLGGPANLASGGHNFVGIRLGANAVFPVGLPNANGDWVGTVGFPIDPQLQPLAENGGYSMSHMPILAPASAVIDQGSCTGAPSVTDQRDWHNGPADRIFDVAAVGDLDDGCDIGAIEAYLEPASEIFVDDFDLHGDWRNWSGIVGWAP